MIAVDAPARFKVVTPLFNKLNVAALDVISPPLTAKSPVRVVFPVTARVLPIVARPPTRRSNPTAAPPRTWNAPVAVLDALVVFVTVVIFPTTNPPPMPTPPSTTNAPVLVELVGVALLINSGLVIVPPLNVPAGVVYVNALPFQVNTVPATLGATINPVVLGAV